MFNNVRTALLLGGLTGLLLLIGGAIGGQNGMTMALVLAAVMNLGAYWFSDRIVLGMSGARIIEESQAPELFDLVRRLSQAAGLPMPRIAVIPEESPNAFATGRDPAHAVVAVTEGLLRLMNWDELAGVLGHEMAHVKNRDTLIGAVAATLAGAVMWLANLAQWGAIFGAGRSDDEEGSTGGGFITLILMAVLAPLAASLIQMAVSRGREYQADETGARLARSPLGLASALDKLGRASQELPLLTANHQTAHLFIVNPLSGRSLASLFSTHPPLEERIARLQAMARR